MLRWMLITGNASVARHAESCGVDRIFVDMEVLGKAERQGHVDTHKANHTLDDLARVRDAVSRAEVMVRLNPLNPGTPEEIAMAVRRGADRLMLPMFRRVADVRTFQDHVPMGVPVTLLVETPQSLTRLPAFLPTLQEGDEIYFGLNDLSLGMGLEFLFEPLAGGLLDRPAAMLRERKVDFGFGGIARIEHGELPAECILGEHVRLGSSWVILSRAFHGGAGDDTAMMRRIDLAAEIGRLRHAERAWRAATPEIIEANRRDLAERVFAIVQGKEQADARGANGKCVVRTEVRGPRRATSAGLKTSE